MNSGCKWNQLPAAKIHLFSEYLFLHARNVNPHGFNALEMSGHKNMIGGILEISKRLFPPYQTNRMLVAGTAVI